MSVTIRIPTVMQRHTGGQAEVQAQGATVGEALRDFASQHEGARTMLFDKAGVVNFYINVFVNSELADAKTRMNAPLQSGDEVLLLPAASGGRQAAEELVICKPSVSIQIPTVLQKYIGGQAQVEIRAETVREALEQVSAQLENPPVRLFDDEGKLRRAFVVFVNDEMVFSSGGEAGRVDKLSVPLQEGDEITITPAAVGG